MSTPIEVPDWTRAIQLIGQDPSGNPVLVAVDANGNIIAVMKGDDAGTLRTLAVDSSGQLIVVPRGQSGNYMDVDANGYITSVMKGLEGATLRTVAVDANGNIVAVMKGEYAGALKTLATDADGRLIAVLTDPEDVWGVFRQMGLAELAVRLGAITTFDRRGDVVWFDDFENGLDSHWRTNADYTGTPLLSAVASRSGAYSVLLETTALSGSGCGIIHYRPLPIESKIGYEVSFAIEQNVGSLEFRMELFDGTNAAFFSVKYLPPTDKWQYLDSAGSWIDLITSVDLLEFPETFHTMKLVIDYTADEYIRVLTNEKETSLAGIAAQTVASAVTPQMKLYITVINDDANIAKVYIDDVILTQNES